MDEAPPTLPEIVELPPALPVRPSGPWNAWITLALSVAVETAVILTQTVLLSIVFYQQVLQGRHPDYRQLAYDGDMLAWATMLTVPVGVGLCVLFARLRRGPDLRDYLALRSFGWGHLGLGVGLLIAIELVFGALQTWLEHPENTEMLQVYQSATWPGFLLVAVIFAAPLQEEVLFRGFMWRGLAASRLGWFGASVICSAGWTLLHVQYDWVEMLDIFVLGLLLGWLRQRSGSIWLPMMVHSLNNLAASASMLWFLQEKAAS